MRLGPGTVVLVVGPSGVGKDALLGGARHILHADPRFVFVRREITRPPHPSEAFTSATELEFEQRLEGGAYALSWRAHGLGYGIPIAIDDDIRAGRIAVFNASRAIVHHARERYARVRVILVECPVAVRAQRMAARGRESAAAIEERLSRTVDEFDADAADVRVDNSGSLDDGVAQLTAALRSFLPDQGPAKAK